MKIRSAKNSGRLPSVISQDFGESDRLRRKMHVVIFKLVGMGIEGSKNCSKRRNAEGNIREVLFEERTGGGEMVYFRRSVAKITVRGKVIGTQSVDNDQYDVTGARAASKG